MCSSWACFFGIFLPAFVFDFPAVFLFCWTFQPNAFWACFSVRFSILSLFSNLLACYCKITWHRWKESWCFENAKSYSSDNDGAAPENVAFQFFVVVILCVLGKSVHLLIIPILWRTAPIGKRNQFTAWPSNRLLSSRGVVADRGAHTATHSGEFYC